jgi:glutaredoxin-related protein
LVIGIVTILVFIGGVYLFSKTPSENASVPSETPSPTASEAPLPNSSYEYYWSETCGHCANVSDFFSSWEKADKVQVDKKVISDRANANLMSQRARSCNLPFNQVGIPFLFTPNGECIIGDRPIINYFESLDL